MCEKFQITHVKLNQSKSVEKYNNQMTSKFIIHIIYPTLTVEGHKELTAPMFITHLRYQSTILKSL